MRLSWGHRLCKLCGRMNSLFRDKCWHCGMPRSEHAKITQEIRKLWLRVTTAPQDAGMRLLSDFIAAREKAARLKGLRDAYSICEEYRKREYGPHGTEWVSCEDVNEVKDEGKGAKVHKLAS